MPYCSCIAASFCACLTLIGSIFAIKSLFFSANSFDSCSMRSRHADFFLDS
jgi:hypothetical protein